MLFFCLLSNNCLLVLAAPFCASGQFVRFPFSRTNPATLKRQLFPTKRQLSPTNRRLLPTGFADMFVTTAKRRFAMKRPFPNETPQIVAMSARGRKHTYMEDAGIHIYGPAMCVCVLDILAAVMLMMSAMAGASFVALPLSTAVDGTQGPFDPCT